MTSALKSALSRTPAGGQEAAAHALLFWARRAPTEAAIAACLQLVCELIKVCFLRSLLNLGGSRLRLGSAVWSRHHALASPLTVVKLAVLTRGATCVTCRLPSCGKLCCAVALLCLHQWHVVRPPTEGQGAQEVSGVSC